MRVGKQASLGRSAALLAVIGVIAKFIGALYRVPLTNIVGAEGMGLYQMVFPVYTVLLAFCGGGISGAVSRVTAKYTARGQDRTALRAMRAALVPLIPVAAVATAAVMIFRNVISGIQGNTDAALCYLTLAPSLLFAGGIGVLRGYFQGRSKMLPSGISQLIEQVVKLALGLYLSRLLLARGVMYAVAGALLGVTASEFFALVYLTVRFLIAKRKNKRYVKLQVRPASNALSETAAEAVIISDRELLHEMYSFALPVTLGSLVLPITQMIDSALVINLLTGTGIGTAEATALFGLFVGPVGTLINMPTVVVVSVSVAFLPALTATIEGGGDGVKITQTASKWIMLFIIPVTVMFAVFPERVCGALYRRGLSAYELSVAARLLRVQAISVFYAGTLQISTTVLQARGAAHRPVINLVIGACVKVALTPFLVRTVGVIGAAAATAACYGVAALLTSRAAYKRAPIGADVRGGLVVPLCFSALAAGAACLTLFLLSYANSLSSLMTSIIAGAVFLAVYFAGVVMTKALDIKSLFGGLRVKGRGAEKKTE